MSYKVDTIPLFDRQAKRLGKKYLSLKKDLDHLITSLEINPNQGDALGNNLYKIRKENISDKEIQELLKWIP